MLILTIPAETAAARLSSATPDEPCRTSGTSSAAASSPAYEVRAFYAQGRDFAEDPVTGSLNAALAQWLIPLGRLPRSYVASQGTKLHRTGRIHVEATENAIWIGGDTVTVITGDVDLD
jgi:predicted PhzF superfamily epimerase YddE/YHI9